MTGGRGDVIAELQKVVSTVCQRHGLPLAQTWLPMVGIVNQSEAANEDFDPGSETIYLSTRKKSWILDAEDAPFYVRDSNMWGFRQACVEHKLELGQVQ